MRKIILAMQMTLDGFSTGPNGEMDWLPPFDNEEVWKDLHQEMWNQLDNADTMLLGRVTYQIWELFGLPRQLTLKAQKAIENSHASLKRHKNIFRKE